MTSVKQLYDAIIVSQDTLTAFEETHRTGLIGMLAFGIAMVAIGVISTVLVICLYRKLDSFGAPFALSFSMVIPVTGMGISLVSFEAVKHPAPSNLQEAKAESCEDMFTAIRRGEVRYLSEEWEVTVKKTCGTSDFIDAVNEHGSQYSFAISGR